MRPVIALSVLALLAACGQSTQTSGGKHAAAVYGHYNRPSSYDPPGPPGDPWGPWIRDAARRFDVPERWIREVMRQESGGRVGATSPVGAMGLMQVMPGTYREVAARYGLGDDPYHPYDSIMAGAAYIREMYDLYGTPAFLAAYNAGPRRLEDYLWNSRGLPAETRNYVRRIGPNIIGHHPQRQVAPEIQLAGEIPLSIPAGPRRMDAGTMLALREQRNAQQPGIQVAQLPPGPVVRMEPIPDGSTERPVQVASLGPVVRMDPIPDGSTYRAGQGEVVRMEPIPDGSTYGSTYRSAAPASQGEVVRMEPIPNPPEPVPEPAPRRAAPEAPVAAAPRPAALAARPAPARTQVAALTAPPARPAPAAPAAGFGLMGTAQAATMPNAARPVLGRAPAPAPALATGGGWAVQVGAFANQAQARGAAAAAKDAAGGRPMVQPVGAGKAMLYRARVTGLSQSAAQAACDRLRRKGGCMVISPDSQG
ncbi:lytic transglycosylase domain-containing protein [Roseicella frigidaeris]|uniref:Murein transglycosylase n=1 Tax=Roseicella frigidaeris TaxID=2230885 RepID=A0A327MCE7_9PROT|nr:lytic transglycosylase domain-containing protein [Roseicella frigidaeris]RAI60901.1 murein transglycosylase [Roseicella frigidaeris]